jgi:hypothetical protein
LDRTVLILHFIADVLSSLLRLAGLSRPAVLTRHCHRLSTRRPAMLSVTLPAAAQSSDDLSTTQAASLTRGEGLETTRQRHLEHASVHQVEPSGSLPVTLPSALLTATDPAIGDSLAAARPSSDLSTTQAASLARGAALETIGQACLEHAGVDQVGPSGGVHATPHQRPSPLRSTRLSATLQWPHGQAMTSVPPELLA